MKQHIFLPLVLTLLLVACNDDGPAATADSTFTQTDIVTEVPESEGTKPDPKPEVPNPVLELSGQDIEPEDRLVESNISAASYAVEIKDVSEIPSIKHHQMLVDDKLLKYTASAGHLIIDAPSNDRMDNPPPPNTPGAAVFYTAYTLDGAARNTRPVTFFFNDGPSSSSIWLHMGSWAPKRLVTGNPSLPLDSPTRFPLVDNAETLLDQSDLVFVDPVGSGYSVAIKPFGNNDFFGAKVDAAAIRDFVTKYTNQFNRQSSPKYLYGESYGGIRVPIAAHLLVDAGTVNFKPDPSGKPPVVLSGFMLNSPVIDYRGRCQFGLDDVDNNCASYFPTYAMLADYHGASRSRGDRSFEEYANVLRKFADEEYAPAVALFKMGTENGTWYDYATTAGKPLLDKTADLTGVAASTWINDFNMDPGDFRSNVAPGFAIGRYDGRSKLPYGLYDPNEFDRVGFKTAVEELLPDFVNYKNKNAYLIWANVSAWRKDDNSSVDNIIATLTLDPSLKILVFHGYHDTATPFHQTELDLKAVGLEDRIPVHVFEGGHMMYYNEPTRKPLKKLLTQFYQAPPYTAPVGPRLAVNSGEF